MLKEDFLLEIGTEELPPGSVSILAKSLADYLQQELQKAELKHGNVEIFASPRRIAVLIEQLDAAQKARIVERRGPQLSAAYDAQRKPTPAAVGFANSCDVSVEELQVQKTDKGDWLYFKQEKPGEKTLLLLPMIVQKAIAQLAIARPMRWSASSIAFVRPVHWILMLLGNEVVTANILGKEADNKTYGHRFHHPDAIVIKTPKEYAEKLMQVGKVIANFSERKNRIRKEVQTLAIEKNCQALIDEDLLDEITGLVEWPVALLCQFDPQFLEVPTEALITAMKNHQRCFPLINEQKMLQPYFVTVSNIESKNPGRVIAGNERVMRARLADAQFFYHNDCKHSVEHRLELLKTIVFQRKLGSLYEKSQRISNLAAFMANNLQASVEYASRAGLLAKTDLASTMVNEFAELQGIMGYYYAKNDKEAEEVARAIREHYQPRFAGDAVPSTVVGSLVSVADKIDTIVGIYGINQAPTGEKDPFGLRRAALGVLRILIENHLWFDLKDILQEAIKLYDQKLENQQVLDQTLTFIMERLRAWYLEHGVDTEVFAAVLSRYPTQPLDFHHRIQAVQQFQMLPEAKALTAANKRVSNILKKEDGLRFAHMQINPSLLVEPAEQALVALLEEKSKEVENLCDQAQYEEALTYLATLQKPIDHFFDKVMVMVEDEKLRDNRLALLANLRQLFLRIADISLL